MKWSLLIIFGIFCLLNVFSCSTKEETLDDFGQSYFNSIKNNNLEEAKERFLTQNDLKKLIDKKDAGRDPEIYKSIDRLANDSEVYKRILEDGFSKVDAGYNYLERLKKFNRCNTLIYSKIEKDAPEYFGEIESYNEISIYLKCNDRDLFWSDPKNVSKINGKWKMLKL